LAAGFAGTKEKRMITFGQGLLVHGSISSLVISGIGVSHIVIAYSADINRRRFENEFPYLPLIPGNSIKALRIRLQKEAPIKQMITSYPTRAYNKRAPDFP
jgi:hypothetical protein